MNKDKMKTFIPGLLGAGVYLLIVIIFLVGDKLRNSDIYMFILLILVIPIGIAFIEGIITGSITKIFKKNMLNIFVSTILLSTIMIATTFIFNNTIGIDTLLENTNNTGALSISINSEITIGSIIQPIIIIFVASSLGNLIGTKVPTIINKFKS